MDSKRQDLLGTRGHAARRDARHLHHCEHTLISKGQEHAVRATRQTFHSAMRDEFQRTVEEITGRQVINYDTVMFTHPPSVVEIFMLEPEGDRQPRLDREAKEDEGSQLRPLGGLPDDPEPISA